MASSLAAIDEAVTGCRACPRLVAHREAVAADPPARHRGEAYWARPVPNFGDPAARILLVGLAPAAHGANRTGRMFTGDRSGDFLFDALYRAGLANQPHGRTRDDGLALHDVLITAAIHCAPPANKPQRGEIDACRPFLAETWDALPQLRVVVCLGALALDALLRHHQQRGWVRARAPYRFAHGAEHALDGLPTIVCAYHPSQQNTFTGRLTKDMLTAVLERARAIAQRGP